MQIQILKISIIRSETCVNIYKILQGLLTLPIYNHAFSPPIFLPVTTSKYLLSASLVPWPS